jgi:hypothetical protein
MTPEKSESAFEKIVLKRNDWSGISTQSKIIVLQVPRFQP